MVAYDRHKLRHKPVLAAAPLNYQVLNVQTREVTDKFTVEVEMDRRCYEELLDERKNMELQYEERIAQLQDHHAEVTRSHRPRYTRLPPTAVGDENITSPFLIVRPLVSISQNELLFSQLKHCFYFCSEINCARVRE